MTREELIEELKKALVKIDMRKISKTGERGYSTTVSQTMREYGKFERDSSQDALIFVLPGLDGWFTCNPNSYPGSSEQEGKTDEH